MSVVFRSELPAPPASRRQGARGVRGRSRPSPAGGQRPGERLRRRHGRADPREGTGAHPGERLLVRAPLGRVPLALRHGQRRRDHREAAGTGAAQGRTPRPLDAGAAHHAGALRVRGARVPVGIGLGGVQGARHAGGRAAPPRAGGERPPAAAAVQPRHQGGDRPRRERHLSHDGRGAGRPRGQRAAPGELPDLRGGAVARRHPRHHHRRHQVRVRPRRRRHPPTHRRGADPRFVAYVFDTLGIFWQ